MTGLDRHDLAGDASLVGRSLCATYSDRADSFLGHLFERATTGRDGVALLALGGYGRRELSLQSDLDVLLLHDGLAEVAELADEVWYPVWDTGVKLGHAVRTPKQALSLAADDLDSATALLQARHLAGDEQLTSTLVTKMRQLWAKRSRTFLPQLAERVRDRHQRAGEVAFLLEPDIKEGRGGLRDVQSLRWASQGRELLWHGDAAVLGAAYDVLLDTRVELHRRTGRAGDVLLLQEQDGVAAALGHVDADELMREVSCAARNIAFLSDDTWRRVESSLRGPVRRAAVRRRHLAPGVVLRDGMVHLGPDADTSDPVLPLLVAGHAAAEDAPVHRSALESLQVAAPMPDPWSEEGREALVGLLGAGRAAIPQLEALDQHGLLAEVLPEWDEVRSRPQRNAYHTFTVDRHLCEAAANAASLVSRVARPDLLLIGAWLHDIGKGSAGDHTEAGMEIVASVGRRMGFGDPDVATLVAMVEHHLLLPDVAIRRDLDDPDVIDRVACRVGSRERLELLHALTEADSLATGPAAWGPWKAELVETLVRRVGHVLDGGAVEDVTVEFPTRAQMDRLREGARVVVGHGDTLMVMDADRPGLFSRVAGVLALHGLAVLDANIATIEGRALEVLTVRPIFGPTFSWDDVVRDLELALDGRLALEARLSDRAAAYGRTRPVPGVAPKVDFHLDDSATATVIEVHAPDSVGVLYRITAAIAELDLDIVRARVQTFVGEVVDSFYVQDSNGSKVPESALGEVRRALLHAVR